MFLEHNPITSDLHLYWRERIMAEFPLINFMGNIGGLCLIKYIDYSPQKYYSRESFTKYFEALQAIKKTDPLALANILNECESLLGISNRVLDEINESQKNEQFLPRDHNDLIFLIDKTIHYQLLKLYETPLYHLTYILSKHSWIKKKKGTEGLDLKNSIDEIKTMGFDIISKYYRHTIRNGIAHGKVVFTDSEIIYIDKKGNNDKIYTKAIIKVFDRALDIVNGFCLALKLFYFSEYEYIQKYKVSIPQSILLEELQLKLNAPGWKITAFFESLALGDRKQIMVYVKNNIIDGMMVRFYCLSNAYWIERLTPNYDRIFFSLHSKFGKYSPVGWGAYDAKKLKSLRETGEIAPEAFRGVLEEDSLFYAPKYKYPRKIHYIFNLISIMKIILPIWWKKYKNTYFPKPFFIRESEIVNHKTFVSINDASVIVKQKYLEDVRVLIIENRKNIVRHSIRFSKKQCSYFSITRYLPTKYIRVFIYDTDKRLRDLRHSGLIPELIATIEVNTSQIRTIDIINGIADQHGKYRIIWHKNWRGN